jgi:hypothetical protein
MRNSSFDALAQKCDATRGNSDDIMLAPAIPPRRRSPTEASNLPMQPSLAASSPSEMKTCLMRTARAMGARVIVWGARLHNAGQHRPLHKFARTALLGDSEVEYCIYGVTLFPSVKCFQPHIRRAVSHKKNWGGIRLVGLAETRASPIPED